MDRTISEARVLAAHPPEIQLQGLVAALRKMAGEAEDHHVHCRVVGGDPYPEPGAAEALQLYRLAETIVDRAIQHGKPHHILIEFTAGRDRRVIMTVTDRVGCGHSHPALLKSELSDLHARAGSIGATLEIEHPAGAMQLTCSMHAKGPRRQA